MAFLAVAFLNCIPTLFYGYEWLRKFMDDWNPAWLASKQIGDVLGVKPA